MCGNVTRHISCHLLCSQWHVCNLQSVRNSNINWTYFVSVWTISKCLSNILFELFSVAISFLEKYRLPSDMRNENAMDSRFVISHSHSLLGWLLSSIISGITFEVVRLLVLNQWVCVSVSRAHYLITQDDNWFSSNNFQFRFTSRQ